VSELLAEFKGRIGEHNRGESVTLYFPGPVPPVTVSAGGYLRLEHPGFTVRTFRAYARETLAETAERKAEGQS
jgi:hypothetical protein